MLPIGAARAEDSAPIAIAEVKHDGPVDFETEILPILKQNCTACHNHATKKGELVLETPTTILQGGASGAAVEPGKPDESTLLLVASHQSEPLMPPADNKVGAVPLTPDQLGLIKLWIQQGAKGEMKNRAAAINWQPLPAGVNPIYAVAVTPDGQFAACGRANQVFVYHLATGRLLCQLTDPALIDGVLYKQPGVAHRDLVHSLAFSPDGYTLASGDYRAVKLWQRPRDVRRWELAVDKTPLGDFAISPDQKWLAAVGADNSIRLFDAATREPRGTLAGHAASIHSIRFSAESARLFSASEDKTVRVWDVASGAGVAVVQAGSPLSALALSADGAQIITGGADGAIITWRLPGAAGSPIALPSVAKTLAKSADGKRLAYAGDDGAAHIIDLATGQPIRSLPAHTTPLIALAFSTDGNHLATSAADGQIRVWNLTADQSPLVGAGPTAAQHLVWHPSAPQIIAASQDGKATIWSLDGAVAGSVPLKVVGQFSAAPAPTGLAISADAATIYAAGQDGSIVAIATADGARRYAAQHGAPTRGLVLSADGRHLGTIGDDGHLRVWNAADGAVLTAADLTGVAGKPQHITLSADGRLALLATETGAIIVADLATATTLQVLPPTQKPVTALASLADRVLAATAEPGLRVETFSADRRLAGHAGRVTAIESLPGTTQIVSAGDDGALRQWELATGGEVRKLDLGAPITALAIRPDGARVAAAMANNLVRLWQTSDLAQLAEFKGDFKLQQLVARETTRLEVAKGNATAAQSALAAAEKDKSDRASAVQTANDNQQKMITALAEAEAKSKTAAEAQAVAAKTAADAAALAKTLTDAKAANDKLVADLTTAVALASDASAKAQAAADAQANALAATGALALATKAAVDAMGADQSLAAANNTAQKLSADTTAMDEGAKSLTAALAKFVEEKKAALATATEKKTADEQAFVTAEAAAKTAADAKAAADKAAKEAADAAQAALANKNSAEKSIADAQRSLAIAEQAIPLRKEIFDKSTAIATNITTQLAAAQAEAPKHDLPVRALAFSPNNLLLVAGGDDAVIRAYRADDGAAFETFAAHQGAVSSLGFAADGALISTSADSTARSWDLDPVWVYAGQIGPPSDQPTNLEASAIADRVLALSFSPDGQLLATGGGQPSRAGEVKIWNVANRSLVRELPEAHSDTVLGLEFSPDGTQLATCGSDKFVRVFDIASGALIRSFEGHTHHVLGVAWRADGKVLASSGADGVVKVWNLETGEQQRTIAGFGKEVTSVNFIGTSPMTLASSGDKTVRQHNTNDGANPLNFGGATDFLYSACVTADGQRVVAGGQDSVLRVWTIADGKQVLALEPPATK
jgi:WD40 repeat protein